MRVASPVGESLSGKPWGAGGSPASGLLYLVPSTNSTSRRCVAPVGWLRIQCDHGGIWWKPLRCRHCVPCLAARKDKTIAQLSTALRSASNCALITLTSLPGASWPFIMRRFSRFVSRARKRFGHFEYAAIKEEGSRARMKHLHVIVTGAPWLPRKWLSGEWTRLSGAWNVDVRRIRTEGAASYVAKYVGKAILPLRKGITYSKLFRQKVELPKFETIYYTGGPEARPWVAVLPDGTLVERYCTCLEWGPKENEGVEYVSGEGLGTCQTA